MIHGGSESEDSGGREDHDQQRQAAGARPPDHPVHRGRRHRAATSGAPRVRVFDAAVAEGLRRQAQDRTGWRSTPARRPFKRLSDELAARRDRRGVPRVPGGHQGPADHAGRRRHPLAQRGAAPDARPVRLPAPGALVQGRALAGEAAREGRHGDLPREHRGHLRRHRVRGRHAEAQEVPRAVLKQEFPKEYDEDPLPEDLRHRHQAGVEGRHRAAGPRRDRVRDRATSARA